MNDIIELVLKVGGGAFGMYFGLWLTSFIKNQPAAKKTNGKTICKDHYDLVKTTVENNAILREIRDENRSSRKDAREERTKLFDKVDELEKDIGVVKKDVAVLATKVRYIEDTDAGGLQPMAKEIVNTQFLVLDDQVADSTCKTIESYFAGYATCTPVFKIDDAIEALKQQTYDFCIIDYYLNDIQSGFEFADYCEVAYPNMVCIIYSGREPFKIPTKYRDRYIDKPFKRDEFIAMINKFL